MLRHSFTPNNVIHLSDGMFQIFHLHVIYEICVNAAARLGHTAALQMIRFLFFTSCSMHGRYPDKVRTLAC